MTRFSAFTCTLFASALFTAQACTADTVYQSTDKRGNPVFTDQPQPNARPVEVQPTNTTPSLTPAAPPGSSTEKAFTGYTRIELGIPSSIPNGLAPTTVGIELQPALQPGHRWQLLMDGASLEMGTGSSATIERLERGTHQFELRVIDASGALIGTSSNKEVFVYWPGKNR
jgi:hypothetical protein